MLEVRVLGGDGKWGVPFETDYVSIVNRDTFGPPPLIAPKEGQRPLASVGQRVLFVNTAVIEAFVVERVSDGG